MLPHTGIVYHDGQFPAVSHAEECHLSGVYVWRLDIVGSLVVMSVCGHACVCG